MVRVAISGATGAVGRALVPAVEAAPDLELVAQAAPSLGTSLAEALAGGADVAVDFSVPTAAAAACEAAIAARVPLVLGTSGLAPDDLERLGERAAAAGVAIFNAPNFAIGAVLLMRFAEQARPLMDACEIVELHAATKRDAPSGTALATAARLGGDVPIHSVRLPGLVAHQEVIFGALGQTLTCATTRRRVRPSFPVRCSRSGASASLPPGLTSGLEAFL